MAMHLQRSQSSLSFAWHIWRQKVTFSNKILQRFCRSGWRGELHEKVPVTGTPYSFIWLCVTIIHSIKPLRKPVFFLASCTAAASNAPSILAMYRLLTTCQTPGPLGKFLLASCAAAASDTPSFLASCSPSLSARLQALGEHQSLLAS